MKILFFIDSLTAGGAERRLVELVKGLKNHPEIQFELVVMDKEVHYEEIFDFKIKIHYFIRRSKRDLRIFKMLFEYCKKFKPDIIHSWNSMTTFYSVLVCKLLKIKLINGMVADAPVKKSIFNKRMLRARLTFPFSNIIVGNSRAGLIAYKAPENKSICIRNGFNFDRLSKLESITKLKELLEIRTDYVIGMVATFCKLKDYRTFFDAAQMLLKKRNDVTFIAIGIDTDSAAARKMIQERFIGNFKLLGRRSDVESLINLMDICVLSTFTEGISNAILEYMALGKPVIATEGGGTNEIVLDGETGFLVNRSDTQALFDKMQILLNDSSLSFKMGKVGRERIRDHFSISKMIEKYISVYNQVCMK